MKSKELSVSPSEISSNEREGTLCQVIVEGKPNNAPIVIITQRIVDKRKVIYETQRFTVASDKLEVNNYSPPIVLKPGDKVVRLGHMDIGADSPIARLVRKV